MKRLVGCLITIVVVIILGVIGIFAFFTISPREGIEESHTSSVISTSPDGKWQIHVIEQSNGEPFEVYYGRSDQEIEKLSMIYISVEDYESPSADLEWQEDTEVDVIIMDEDQEVERITLMVGEE